MNLYHQLEKWLSDHPMTMVLLLAIGAWFWYEFKRDMRR